MRRELQHFSVNGLITIWRQLALAFQTLSITRVILTEESHGASRVFS